MTARSPSVGLIELEPSLYRRADDPVCAQRVRDGVINGVLHKADSASQVIINWQPANEDLVFGVQEPKRWATGRELTMAAVAAGEFYALEPAPFAAIDVPCFGSGQHYELRLQTAWGAAGQGFSTNPPAATITLRIYLYPWGDRGIVGPTRPSRSEHERLVDHVWEASYAADVVGYDGTWLQGNTRGDGAFATKLVLDRETTWPRDEIVAPNAPAGLEPAPRTVLRVGVGVVASVSLAPDAEGPLVIPLMRALHMQGFVGEAA